MKTKFNLANTLAFVTLAHAMRRDTVETRELADQGVALCEDQRKQ